MSCALNVVNVDTFQLTGAFDMAQLATLIGEGEKLIIAQAGKALHIDLSHWAHAQSAALSLLLQWLRCAKQHNVKLAYLNPQSSLLGLAKVSHLDKILFA